MTKNSKTTSSNDAFRQQKVIKDDFLTLVNEFFEKDVQTQTINTKRETNKRMCYTN